MNHHPIRLALAMAAAAAVVLAGCSTQAPPLTDPHGDPVSATPYQVTPAPGANPTMSDDAANEQPAEPEVIETLATPTEHGLTTADEQAASQTAIEFVETIWAWDSTDTSDRAGLERALPLATPDLAAQLQAYVSTPVFTPEEWATLAGQSSVGSLIEVIAAFPIEDGLYDANTYTVRLVYNTYIRDTGGAPLPRAEDARYATLVLTRSASGSWLISALPYQEAEQIIELSPSALP